MKNIKKIVSVLLAVALCATLAVSALASENTFIPSGAVEVQSAVKEGTSESVKVTITSVSEAEASLAEEQSALLHELYDGLSDGSMTLPGQENPKYLEMMYLTIEEGQEGSVTMELQLEILPEGDVIGFMYIDGEWKQLENVTHSGDGKITCTVEQEGPVVFIDVIEKTEEIQHVDQEKEETRVVEGKDIFVGSITYKTAPFVVKTSSNMGYDFSNEFKDCLVVTSIGQAKDESTDTSPEARKLLLDVYDQLSDGSMTLPLEGNYVIRELVDISFAYEACQLSEDHGNKTEKLAAAKQIVTVDFNLRVSEDTKIAVLTYIDGQWQEIESVINNGDGTITCVFEDLCPVAFVVLED